MHITCNTLNTSHVQLSYRMAKYTFHTWTSVVRWHGLGKCCCLMLRACCRLLVSNTVPPPSPASSPLRYYVSLSLVRLMVKLNTIRAGQFVSSRHLMAVLRLSHGGCSVGVTNSHTHCGQNVAYCHGDSTVTQTSKASQRFITEPPLNAEHVRLTAN